MAVRRPEQPLARAVGRMLGFDHVRPADKEAFGQPWAHGLGDIGHRFEIGHAAMVEPVEDLLGTQFRLLGVEARFVEKFANTVLGQTDQVHAAVFARRDVTRDGNRVDLPGDAHQCRLGHGSAPYRAWRGIWPH